MSNWKQIQGQQFRGDFTIESNLKAWNVLTARDGGLGGTTDNETRSAKGCPQKNILCDFIYYCIIIFMFYIYVFICFMFYSCVW